MQVWLQAEFLVLKLVLLQKGKFVLICIWSVFSHQICWCFISFWSVLWCYPKDTCHVLLSCDCLTQQSKTSLPITPFPASLKESNQHSRKELVLLKNLWNAPHDSYARPSAKKPQPEHEYVCTSWQSQTQLVSYLSVGFQQNNWTAFTAQHGWHKALVYSSLVTGSRDLFLLLFF